MCRNLLTVGSFSSIVGFCLLWPAAALAQVPDADTKAKLDAIKKQIDDLQKQIDSLHAQENDLQAKEFAKLQVEIKGRLQRSGNSKSGWAVTIKRTTFQLDFGDNKEWADLAKKLEDKTVKVTGSSTIGQISNGLGKQGPGLHGVNPLALSVSPVSLSGTTTFTIKVETFKAP